MKTEGQELQLFTVLALFMHGVQMLVVGMWAGGWVGGQVRGWVGAWVGGQVGGCAGG